MKKRQREAITLEKQIKHISPLATGKLVASIVFVIAIIIFPVELFFRVDQPVIGTSILLSVLLPIIYSTLSGVAAILVCALYNIFAARNGGIALIISTKK